MEKPGKYYAVAVGRETGIVKSWAECKKRVDRFSGAVFKAFSTLEAAEEFLRFKSEPGTDQPRRNLPKIPCRRLNSSENIEKPKKKQCTVVKSRLSSPVGPLMYLFTDGACQDTRCGAGFLIKDAARQTVFRGAQPLAEDTTNNEAEYDAFILGLQACLDRGFVCISAHLDSMLVVEQCTGYWAVKEARLQAKWEQVQNLLREFAYFRIEHVKRDLNCEADYLSKEALR